MNIGKVEKKNITEAVGEALSRPLDYDPTKRAKFIRQMMREMPLAMRGGLSESELREKFSEFSEHFPELFKKIFNRSDLTPINTMLAMLDRVSDGSMSTHQASVVVGQRLADRYVLPRLTEPGDGKPAH